MAKPLKVPDIWSSVNVYTAGPKVGQLTKTDINLPVGESVEGHVPGKLFPTTANGFNRFCHDISQTTKWVHEGKANRDLDPHIVETDATGRVFAGWAYFGGTLGGGPALKVDDNQGGTAAHFTSHDNTTLLMDMIASVGSGSATLHITNDSNDAFAYGAQIFGTNGFGTDGCGGVYASVNTNFDQGNGDKVSAIYGLNAGGRAGNFRGDTVLGGYGTYCINEGVGGISLAAGFGEGDASNNGGVAILGEGGPGYNNGGSPIEGGTGVFGRGGRGINDTVFPDGGEGIIGAGGYSDSATPGIGGFFQPGVGNGLASAIELRSPDTGQSVALMDIELPTGTTGDAIYCRPYGGRGMLVEGHHQTGVEIGMTTVGSGLYPALRLTNQDLPTTIPIGAIWVENNTAVATSRNLRCKPSSVYSIARYKNWCRAFGFATLVDVVDTSLTFIVAATFDSENTPDAIMDVIITVTCELEMAHASGAQDEVIEVHVEDLTAASTQISFTHETLHRPQGLNDGEHVSLRIPYTLPAAGARTFEVKMAYSFTPDDDCHVNNCMITVEPA